MDGISLKFFGSEYERDKYINEKIGQILRGDMDFFDQALFFEDVLVNGGMTQLEFAAKIGRTQGYVSNKIRLLKLSDKVRSKVREYNIPERHARALVHIENEQAQLKMIDMIRQFRYTASETELIMSGDELSASIIKKHKRTEELRKRQHYLRQITDYPEMVIDNMLEKVSEASSEERRGDDGENFERSERSAEANETAVKNLKQVKDFTQKLKAIVDRMKKDGVAVRVNFENGKESIRYEIVFPKKDNMLLK